MPIPPGELIVRYNNLSTTLDGGAVVPVSVHNYACAWYGSGQADRRAYRERLYHACRSNLLGMTGVEFSQVFDGGGSVENIAKCLRLAARYRIYFHAGPPAGAPPGLDERSGVRRVTDAYIGLDCTGFVGNWVRVSGLPHASVSRPPLDWLTHGHLVSDLAAVRAYDLIVWVTGVHITVIADALPVAPGSNTRHLTVCESAAGGLQKGPYTLRHLETPRTLHVQRHGLVMEERTTVFEIDAHRHGNQVPVYILRYQGL